MENREYAEDRESEEMKRETPRRRQKKVLPVKDTLTVEFTFSVHISSDASPEEVAEALATQGAKPAVRIVRWDAKEVDK